MGVFAIKGVSGERLIWEKSKQKRKGSEKLFLVGVDDAKTQIMERLKKTDKDDVGYVNIADQGVYSAEFAKQLLSEYRDITFVANRPVLKWTRKSTGHRAEVLDCFVYALAVRSTLKPNWETRRRNLTRVAREDSDGSDDWHTF
jgi:phage terminase large subunit GpA-like protein